MTAQLTLYRLSPADFTLMDDLAVAPGQQRFVGTVEDLKASGTESFHYHLIKFKDEPVGFFNLDLTYANQYDFANQDELGLRAFFIDARHQGHGYGKAAACLLKPYLQHNYPHYRSLVLTVNCKNPAAYRVYQHSGFIDTGELYHGGAAGPQHIMRLPL